MTSARAKSCGSNGRRSSSASPMPISFTGRPSSCAIATRDAALRRPVELRQHDPGHVDGVAEQPRLLQAVLAGGRVDDEQRLVRRPRQRAAITRRTFAQLLHQVRLRVQAARGVDDHDVAPAGARRLDRVEGDCGGVAAVRRADEVGAGALGPDLQLLLGRGAESVGGGQDDACPCSREQPRRACRSWSSCPCRSRRRRARRVGRSCDRERARGRRAAARAPRPAPDRDRRRRRASPAAARARRSAGTPTSAMISDSSSRSHASSSEASKAASEISAVSACRLFESESRSRREEAGALLLRLGGAVRLAEQVCPRPRHRAEGSYATARVGACGVRRETICDTPSGPIVTP